MPTPTSVTSHYGTPAEDLMDLTTPDPAVAPPRRADYAISTPVAREHVANDDAVAAMRGEMKELAAA
eukprot:12375021-Heterocapsa_arctica.AAC.1